MAEGHETPHRLPGVAEKVANEKHMDVSRNNGFSPQNGSILIGFSMIFTIHFGGFPPIFGNFHIDTHTKHKRQIGVSTLKFSGISLTFQPEFWVITRLRRYQPKIIFAQQHQKWMEHTDVNFTPIGVKFHPKQKKVLTFEKPTFIFRGDFFFFSARLDRQGRLGFSSFHFRPSWL